MIFKASQKNPVMSSFRAALATELVAGLKRLRSKWESARLVRWYLDAKWIERFVSGSCRLAITTVPITNRIFLSNIAISLGKVAISARDATQSVDTR